MFRVKVPKARKTIRRRELTDADVKRLIRKQVRENAEALKILAKY